MAIGMRFQVLDVGQGSGNFIEYWDDDEDLIATVLIDLGSEYAKEEAGGAAVAYIVGKLQAMDDPTLDAVMLSHSDSDHVNLLTKIFDQMDVTELSIGAIYYGGERSKYTKHGTNILTEAEKYLPKGETSKTFRVNVTNYDKKKGTWG